MCKQKKKSSVRVPVLASSALTIPSWYGQHKYVKHYKDKLKPLFAGRLAPNSHQEHTIASTIEYHAIGVVMNSRSNIKGEVGFTQIGVRGPCGQSSPVKSGKDMLGGHGSCSPKDGKITIKVFNDTNSPVEYVIYDGEKTKG